MKKQALIILAGILVSTQGFAKPLAEYSKDASKYELYCANGAMNCTLEESTLDEGFYRPYTTFLIESGDVKTNKLNKAENLKKYIQKNLSKLPAIPSKYR
jgi:hypothetical protein